MCIDMVYCLTYIQLLCYALIVAQNRIESSVKFSRILHLTGGPDQVWKMIPWSLVKHTHGGRTGGGMLKYPHIKKNAQHSIHPAIPRLATAASQCIITCMSTQHYYYVMCQRGSLVHRAYVRMDPESADILHDSLESRYDLVQVCAVSRSDVEPELLL
jgi:hypothetical protein